ncbi:MAG: bifunctional pyr operon transcriptional regulator/uracil phosphoribosyltransferase PyrR, partial [Spirochaetota bacterium]
MSDTIIMTSDQIDSAIAMIAEKVYESAGESSYAVIGIQTRGVYLADRIRTVLEQKTGKRIKNGVLDITFYRDDLASRGSLPVIKETRIDFDIDGMTLVLVDDVLFTGRTIKAALDTLTDYGRPKKILLAVLADRGHRELP